METTEGFLLSRQWRDLTSGVDLSYWACTADGPLRIHIPAQRPVCFVERSKKINLPAGAERKPLSLASPDGAPVDGIYTVRQRDMTHLNQRYATDLLESDIKPTDRFLMERFISAGFTAEGELHQRHGYREIVSPKLRPLVYKPLFSLASIDIETEGLTGRLYSIAVHSGETSIVLMVAEGSPPAESDFQLQYFDTEHSMLVAFFQLIQRLDPDVLIGWNVINFDLNFLAERCRELRVPFAIGRGGEESAILQPGSSNQIRLARIPGRAVLDGIDTLRAAFWSFESFALEHVAQQLLGRGKTISASDRLAHINEMYQHDKPALARYNIEDCRLVTEVFAKTDLINFAIQRAQMTGLAIDKTGGAVQTFDNLYLPRLHRKGFVAPASPIDNSSGSPGGYVLDSQPGIYKNVIVLDFKSLYPSIIRTFLIDPLGLAVADENGVPGFEGASFSRTQHILPELIRELWSKRDEAKANSDAALSQAIKIIMNSLYGVLGSSGCRFHHHQLASSITRRGHEIILASREQIQAAGYTVIYGDTDSLFVLLGDNKNAAQANSAGLELQTQLNEYWCQVLQQRYQLPSYLEVEFETHYLRFVMPTVRGSESGSKKRYAGKVRKTDGSTEVIFKGLEAVRTDWTPLAREFQRILYEKVFNDDPVKELIKETTAELLAGELDEKLVYRKRLRRRLSEYSRNVPPHVQAARKLSGSPGSWIHYVITVNGPEPADERVSALDYQHYVDRQLAPVADGILHFFETSYEAITSAQFELF
ncbi:hypothetical protein AB833_19905 [Chromatiales bacterium (ex Bugula neritina AB1)]|nr:hypothetical protein AB833_19905 [Chromatiales bacterium (ex Bugula neritina AB1)]